MGTAGIEEKLQKRIEFSQLGLVITRDEAAVDIILEVHHDHFTRYVYTAIDAKEKDHRRWWQVKFAWWDRRRQSRKAIFETSDASPCDGPDEFT